MVTLKHAYLDRKRVQCDLGTEDEKIPSISNWFHFHIVHDEKQAIKNTAKVKILHSGAIARHHPPPSYRALPHNIRWVVLVLTLTWMPFVQIV